MTITIYDRVQETTITSGTGNVTLQGAVAGYLSFTSTVGVSNQTYYGIVDDVDNVWEIGIGTLISDTVLRRDTIIASSSGSSLIDFSGNQSSVFVDVPAEKRIQIDSPNIGTIDVTNFAGDHLSLNTISTHDVTSVNVNTDNNSPNTIGQTDQTTFYGDGSNLTGITTATPTLQQVTDAGDTASNILVTNINTSATGSNTVGTSGQTTFYGDGSNLTGINTSTPTLQEVTDTGDTASNIAVISINSALSSSNTIGTSGHTTFYGDGSNLTGLYRAVDDQSTSSYTLSLGDQMVTFENSSAVTVTVPSSTFPILTEIDLIQMGTGQVTISPAGGVTVNSYVGKMSIAGQYAAATLKQLSSNNWILIGNLA